YYVRGNSHEDAEYLFDWLQEIAEGATKMTRTKVGVHVDTDCHEIIPNLPLSKAIARNFKRVGPPRFTATDLEFARQLQTAVPAELATKEAKPLRDDIEEIPAKPYPATGGSTDVGDVS